MLLLLESNTVTVLIAWFSISNLKVFWEYVTLNLLANYGVIKATKYWTKHEVVHGILNFLIVVQMV